MIPELSYTTLYIHNIFSSCTLITLYGNNLRQLQSPPVIICHYTDMFTWTNQHHIKEGSLSKMKTGSNASLPVSSSDLFCPKSRRPICEQRADRVKYSMWYE
ncbi:hypothetical protein Peur_017103 [Populus x canadensis]